MAEPVPAPRQPVVALNAGKPVAGEVAFKPETFFLGRTQGAGVVRDPFGRVMRRCQIVSLGTRGAAYGALQFDETFTYDDGEVDVWRWAMMPDTDGSYMAIESNSGSGIAGRRVGDDYVISFRRAMGPARGLLSPRFLTRLTLLAPHLALKTVKLRFFGLPLVSLTAVYWRPEG